jgi:hypothetical protein
MGRRTEHGPFDGKLKRFATSLVLPIDKNREGECRRCGACCRFLVDCPFLRPAKDDPNAFECRAYLIRPLQCRKYPRTEAEQIHHPCGYRFRRENEPDARDQ